MTLQQRQQRTLRPDNIIGDICWPSVDIDSVFVLMFGFSLYKSYFGFSCDTSVFPMGTKYIMAHVALGFLLFFALFLSILPSILFVRYFPPPSSHNIAWFVLEALIYIMMLTSILCSGIMFIPGIIFRAFRLAPKEGEYELDIRNKEIFKWILSQGLYRISMFVGKISALSKKWVIRLFGAKIGHGVIFQGGVTDPYFLEVGDHTIVGGGAIIFTHLADKPRHIVFRSVRIGKYCLLGHQALIMPGVVLDDYVIVGAYTLVPKNKHLNRGLWVGIPARRIKDIDVESITREIELDVLEIKDFGKT